MKKTVYLTSDHAGYDTKIVIAKILENEGYKVVIEGATNAETKTSYAEIGIQFAKQYIADKEKNKHLYVALCGSGIGISIALNRFKTIICARVTSEEEARLAKLHNNANILCFGGRLINAKDAVKMFHIWETTEYEGGRHDSRIETLNTVGEN